MDYIMQVDLKLEKDIGQIIVGGLNTSDIDDVNKFHLVNGEIVIKSLEHSYNFKVKTIDIFTSIIGQINLGIVLYDSADFYMIEKGDHVYRS